MSDADAAETMAMLQGFWDDAVGSGDIGNISDVARNAAFPYALLEASPEAVDAGMTEEEGAAENQPTPPGHEAAGHEPNDSQTVYGEPAEVEKGETAEVANDGTGSHADADDAEETNQKEIGDVAAGYEAVMMANVAAADVAFEDDYEEAADEASEEDDSESKLTMHRARAGHQSEGGDVGGEDGEVQVIDD